MKQESLGTRNKKLLVITIALSLVIVSLAGLTMFWASLIPELVEQEEIPEFAYGDDIMEITYSPDARLLTPTDEEKGQGIEITALETMFSDGFESGNLGDWDSNSLNTYVTGSTSHSGDYSCKFNPSLLSTEYLKKEDAVDIDHNDKVDLKFATEITTNFAVSSNEGIPRDFFIAKLSFEDGKTLVYLVAGAYWGSSGESVIDVRSQLEGTGSGIWSEIEIDDIQNDYLVQFGEVMPHKADLKFYVKSIFGTVYLDDVKVENTPETEEVSYWDYDGSEVCAYYVKINYEVEISKDVNESSVWMEVKLWVTITSNETIEEELLLQDAVIGVEDFEKDVEWNSKSFALPEDNEDGDQLTYSFDVWISIRGQLEDSSYWIEEEGKEEAFDSFTLDWVSYEVTLTTLLILGSVGTLGTVGIVFGVRKIKKRKELDIDDCDCLGEPGCECPLN